MKIEKITIKNFRCYEETTVEFGKKVTIVIGKNGSGKSTMLSAIKRALSFVFSQGRTNKDINQLSASSPLKVLQFQQLDARYDDREIDYIYPIEIATEASFCNQKIKWSMLKTKMKGNINSSMFKDAIIKYANLRTENDVWPILAYFSDSYPHQETSIVKEVSRILSSGRAVPRNFGYYQWHSYTSCANLWQEKFINTWYKYRDAKLSVEIYTSNLKQLSELNKVETPSIQAYLSKENPVITDDYKKVITEVYSKIDPSKMEVIHKKIDDYNTIISNVMREFNYIKTILFNFFENGEYNDEIKLIDVDIERRSEKEKYILFTFTDGRKVIFEELPAGYKRLLSIVLDLAYRSFILNNGNRGKETGIVLIDEIDLHLHPSLEQDIVQRFTRTFPALQFIFTTHSPLVIANFKQDDDNKILQLTYENGVYGNYRLPNIYGVDYSTSVRDAMGVSGGVSMIKKLKNLYLIELEKEGKGESNAILDRIIALVGSDSVLVNEIKQL